MSPPSVGSYWKERATHGGRWDRRIRVTRVLDCNDGETRIGYECVWRNGPVSRPPEIYSLLRRWTYCFAPLPTPPPQEPRP